MQAASDAVSEVAMPMLVITITVFLVFLPIAFFTGIIKFLFVPLALSVAYAMIASYVVALTVAPVAMERLLRRSHAHRPSSSGHGIPSSPAPAHSRLVDFWNRLNLFDPCVERYVTMLRWCLRHKAVVVMVVTVTFVGSLLMAPFLATEFFPKVDAGQFVLNVSAPEGTRIEKTEAIVKNIEDLIRQHIPPSDLEQIVANIGLPQGWMVLYSPVNGPHQAFLLVNLKQGHTARKASCPLAKASERSRNLSHKQSQLPKSLRRGYEKYSQYSTLRDLQKEARLAKRGLWVYPDPVPPWEWRHRMLPVQ